MASFVPRVVFCSHCFLQIPESTFLLIHFNTEEGRSQLGWAREFSIAEKILYSAKDHPLHTETAFGSELFQEDDLKIDAWLKDSHSRLLMSPGHCLKFSLQIVKNTCISVGAQNICLFQMNQKRMKDLI